MKLKFVLVSLLLIIVFKELKAQEQNPSTLLELSISLSKKITLPYDLQKTCKPGMIIVLFHIKDGNVIGSPEVSKNVPLKMKERFLKAQKEVLEKIDWTSIYSQNVKDFRLLLPIFYYSDGSCGEKKLSHEDFRDNMHANFSLTDTLKEPVCILPVIEIVI